MKKYYWAASFLSILMVGSASADVSIIPRISMESQSYKTKFNSADYVSSGIGVSFSSQSRFYVDFEFFRNNGEKRVIGDATREETTLTLGKSLADGISLFGGYKIARTVGVDETNVNANTSSINEIEIDTDGVFIGVSKSISASKKGAFTLSAAISPMSARVTTEDVNNGEDIVSDESATGISLSAAYNHLLTDSLISSLGYKQQTYSYGGDLGQEEVTALFVKLSYRL